MVSLPLPQWVPTACANWDVLHCSAQLPWTVISSALCLFTAILFLVAYLGRNRAKLSPEGRMVLVTGCDSGFGKMIALELDRLGYTVLAGCLRPHSADDLTLAFNQRSQAFVMDVTKDDDVTKAVERAEVLAEEQGLVLHAIVNNAGIGIGGNIDWLSLQDYDMTMQVNYMGTVCTTQACLPLLRASRGRIINIASIAGRISSPGLSAYSASKYAVEAFSDAIRLELAPWGISTTLIEPGFMKTPIVDGAKDIMLKRWEALDPKVRDLYGEEFLQGNLKLMDWVVDHSDDPKIVRDCVVNCISNVALPIKHRFVLGNDARILNLIRHAPSEFVDAFTRRMGNPVKPCTAVC